MIIISDTSILSGLVFINRLELLGEIYEEVIVPKAVMDELLLLKDFGIELSAVREAVWLKVAEPSNIELENELRLSLDRGESAAIALAQELKPDYLAIDEKKGRKVALSMGIPIIGLVGILITAKKMTLIDAVKPILEDLIRKSGFRLDKKFYAYIIAELGE